MRTKKMILAITCVLMMVALTQSASAVDVSLHGIYEWHQGGFFSITYTHGNTQTMEGFHSSDVTISSFINDGDAVVITYTNTLTRTHVGADGSEIWEWIKSNISVMPMITGPPSPLTVVNLR